MWFGIQKAGGVQCLINLAYRGDFLSWVINLPRSRFLVVDAGHLDRLEAVADDLPLLEHATVLHAAPSRPDPPRVAHEPLEPSWTRRTTSRASRWLDRRRPRHVHLRHHGPLKGAIKQHASDYFSGRTYIEVCGLTAEDTVFCLPLFHSNAQVLAAYPAMIAGARIARRALLVGRLLGPGGGGGRHDPQHGERDQLLHLERRRARSTVPTA